MPLVKRHLPCKHLIKRERPGQILAGAFAFYRINTHGVSGTLYTELFEVSGFVVEVVLVGELAAPAAAAAVAVLVVAGAVVLVVAGAVVPVVAGTEVVPVGSRAEGPLGLSRDSRAQSDKRARKFMDGLTD